jgi:hypothetical protein
VLRRFSLLFQLQIETQHDTAAAGLLVWAKCIYLGQSLGAEEADFD